MRGLVSLLAQNLVARGCSLLSQLALAGLLLPADFGVISLAYTVTSIAATLTNIGIEDVVLQRRRALLRWTGPAFWISLGFATAAGLLVAAVSPLAASAYKAPELVGLLAVLALAMPVGALASVPGMVMRSRMQFGTIALYETGEMAAQALLTVGFAAAGCSAYSFVLPAPILTAVRALTWWHLANTKTSFRPQWRRWKYVVRNTTAVFLTRTASAVIGQGDYIVLGLLASQDVVGGYYFGFRLAAQPLWMLAGNFTGVIFPALTQLRSDPRRQVDAALRASTLLSFCVMPLATLQAAAASPLVTGLFGQKWTASIPVIQLLSLGLAMDAVSWIAGSLLSARGQFVARLRYLLMGMPVFFALVGAGALLDGTVGVAWGVCIFYATTQPLFVTTVYRRLGVKGREVAAIYVWPTVYAAAAAGCGLAAAALPPLAGHPLARVAIIGVAGSAAYAVLVRFLAPEVWLELRRRVHGGLRHTD